VFPASVFPVEVYACINVEAAAPFAQVLPTPVVALPPATYFAAQGVNSSSCIAGALAATIRRPWYGYLFRTLDIHRLLRDSPGAAQLAASSRAARAALAGAQSPSLLLDVAALATLSRSDWTSATAPILLALLLLAASLGVASTCYACRERTKTAACTCCDTAAAAYQSRPPPLSGRRAGRSSSRSSGSSATGVTILRSGTTAAAPARRGGDARHRAVGAARVPSEAARAEEIRRRMDALQRAPPRATVLYSGRPPPVTELPTEPPPHVGTTPTAISLAAGFEPRQRGDSISGGGGGGGSGGEEEDALQRRLHALLSPHHQSRVEHTHWVATRASDEGGGNAAHLLAAGGAAPDDAFAAHDDLTAEAALAPAPPQ